MRIELSPCRTTDVLAAGVRTRGTAFFMNDGKTFVVRCFNRDVHHRSNGNGNVLFFMRGDSIFVKCTDQDCKRWTRIMIRPPGIKLDLEKAALIKKLMPKGYHFDARDAVSVVEE